MGFKLGHLCKDCNKQLSDERSVRCIQCKGVFSRGGSNSSKTKFKKNESSWNKGKKWSEEVIDKMRIAKIKSGFGKGKLNSAYIDGRWMNRDYIYWYNLQRYNSVRSKGTFTYEEWTELKEKYGNMCLCCKKVEPEIVLTQDHVIPISKGGTNTISNVQPLCGSCNSRKYTKETDYRLITNKMSTNSTI